MQLKSRITRAVLPPPAAARHAEYSMLFSADDEPHQPTERLLDVAQSAVQIARRIDVSPLAPRVSAGVRYVDVTESLQAGAREGLAMRQYTYWPDDTHWTARGVSLAADAVAASWPYIDGGSTDATGPQVPHH